MLELRNALERRASRRALVWASGLLLAPFVASVAIADCTLTNTSRLPLPEYGFKLYQGFSGGLYPNGGNNRPPAHLAAGVSIATNQIQPLDVSGHVNTNTGKVVLLSVGMSNATQEWASGDNVTHDITRAFKYRADRDPSENPQLTIVDGAQGGQDASQWTNINGATWSNVVLRLNAAGVTTNQVQAIWLKEAIANESGPLTNHATLLQIYLEEIVRNAKVLYPNLRLAYVSSRTRAYVAATGLNPEPIAYETAYAVKWMIEKQISGAASLNYDPAKGPVVAPYLSWGPYLWADGLAPRSDGFTWPCSDVVSDFTHPSSNGVYAVASQLLAFFKTDPTTAPWFLKKTVSPPSLSASAQFASGVAPLTNHFNATFSGSVTQALWTFDDGEFALAQNPVKIFRTPGLYLCRVTVTDTNGDTALASVPVTVTSTFGFWQTNKFTTSELADPNISGPAADPDQDSFPNLLEYALGLEPKTFDSGSTLNTVLTNGVFTLSFPHLKAATDVTLAAQVSSDLLSWTTLTPTQTVDQGPIETVIIQDGSSPNSARFFRLTATQLR